MSDVQQADAMNNLRLGEFVGAVPANDGELAKMQKQYAREQRRREKQDRERNDRHAAVHLAAAVMPHTGGGDAEKFRQLTLDVYSFLTLGYFQSHEAKEPRQSQPIVKHEGAHLGG